MILSLYSVLLSATLSHAAVTMDVPEFNEADIRALKVEMVTLEGQNQEPVDESGWNGRVEVAAEEEAHAQLASYDEDGVFNWGAQPMDRGHRSYSSGGGCGAVGMASWYGSGRRTANGEAFNPSGLTAAHRSLPMGTHIRVTCARTGRSIVVRINDRGPFVGGRILDLSAGAARALGMRGTEHVSINCI